MRQDVFWFKHDTGARSDVKILTLRRKFGLEGYGAYWIAIELLREATDYKIKFDDLDLFAYEARCDIEIFKYMIDINLLFRDDDDFVFSVSLLERMKNFEIIRQKRAEAGRKGGLNKSQKVANAKQKPSKIVANATESGSKTVANAKQKLSKTVASRVDKNRIDVIGCDGTGTDLISETQRPKNLQNPAPEKTQTESYKIAVQISDYFLNSLKNINPDTRAKIIKTWNDDFDKMLRIDKYTPAQIKWLIDFAHQDSFWRANILSPAKLRKQAEALKLRAEQPQNNGHKKTKHERSMETLQKLFEQHQREEQENEKTNDSNKNTFNSFFSVS